MGVSVQGAESQEMKSHIFSDFSDMMRLSGGKVPTGARAFLQPSRAERIEAGKASGNLAFVRRKSMPANHG